MEQRLYHDATDKIVMGVGAITYRVLGDGSAAISFTIIISRGTTPAVIPVQAPSA